MEENKFWLRLWQTVAVVAAIGILTIGGCTAYESKRVADAIAKGAQPIDARCGIVGTLGGSAVPCVVRAAQR
jgi:hypothetical protein